MPRVTRGILIVAIGLLCSLTAAHGDQLAREMGATDRLLGRADKAFMQGKREVAVQLYGATIKAYEDILSRQSSPGGNDLLAVRLAYCKNQILALLSPRPAPRQLEAAGPVTSASAPPQQPATTPPSAPTAPALSKLPVAPEIEKAVALCRMGKFKQARALITAHLVDHADDAYGLLMLATAALGEGDMAVAGESLDKCLTLTPQLPEVHYNIAQLLLRAGSDFEKATHHYRRAVALGGARDSDLEDVLGIE